MLDPKRVVEVRVKVEGERDNTGSGYLIAPGLVLTAGHVAGSGAAMQVTLLQDRLASKDPPERAAHVLWRSDDPDLDFALLRTDELAGGEVYPVRWDELPATGDLEVEAIGFPDSAYHDTEKISGRVSGGARRIALSQGRGSVRVQVGSPPPAKASAWEGISGAAVFDKAGTLVGVIKERGNSADILEMLPAARLFGLPDVAAALGAASLAPLWRAPRCPEGLRPLTDEETPAKGLRRYLSRDRLPYLSRAERLSTHPANEDSLLDQLAKGDEPGIIITGLGGVGKTRLCLELGRRAQERGWPVFRATRRAQPLSQQLRELAGGADPERPVLLVFDYLETTPRFLDILEQLGDLHADRHNLRFVANCRPSFYSATDFRDINHKRVELSDKEEWQKAITSHILKTFGIPEDSRTERLCRGRPAFAVLLSYLKEGDPSENDLRGLLNTETGFPDWLKRRVHTIFPERDLNDLGEDLARLMALLPLFAPQRSRLEEPLLRILGRLDQDGWIAEEDAPDTNKWLAIALDVFADEIIKRELDRRTTTWGDFVTATFARAREIGCLVSSYRAFERLADPYAELSPPKDNRARQDRWLAIFRSEIATAPAAWRPLLGLVLHGPLLRIEQTAVLVADVEASVLDWLDYPGVRLAVGRLARALATSSKLFDEFTSNRIRGWIIAALEEDRENNYLLTSGFRLLPGRFRSRALEYIKSYPERFATHFLLFRWLKQDQPIEDVREPVHTWLDHFKTSLNASFVIAGWLDAGGSTDFVAADIAEWLEAHTEQLSASYVYYSWLHGGGSLDLVAGGIERWRKRHRGKREAGSVYAGLLHAGVPPETIREELLAWLASYQREGGASFVYCEWLDNGGGAGVIGSHVRAWVDEYGSDLKASRVYRAWLHGGGHRGAVEAKIEAWLGRHRGEPEAGSVYASLLCAGVAPEALRKELLAWLDTYEEEDRASFVYCDWLDHKGGAEAIASHVRAWLDKYRTDVKASHVYRAWLDADGAVDAVRAEVRTWLDRYWDSIEAYQVIDAWLAANQPFETVQEAVRQILDWCCSNAGNPGTISRLSRFGNAIEHKKIAPRAISAALRIAALMPRILESRDADLFDGIVGRFSETAVNLPEIREDFDRMFLRWLEHPSSFNATVEVFFPNQHPEMIFALRRLIENGKIGDDAEPVSRFYAWVLCWQGFSVDGARRKAAVPTPATWDRLEQRQGAREPVDGWILYPVKSGFAVDLGGALAFLPGSEVDIRRVDDPVPLLRSAQSFRIVTLDHANYDIVVSRRSVLEESRAEQRAELVARLKEGRILNGVVKNITDYGAFVDLGGVDGLLHVTDIAWRRITHPSEALDIGQTVKVKVIRFNPETQRISLGMKQLEAGPWEAVERKYTVGARCRGRVVNILDYGAFVELEPGVEGLVHRSKMSWASKKTDPRTIVEIGQEVEVVVLDIDVEKQRISLGIKQVEAGPLEAGMESGAVGGSSP
jgi:predicted RNA-binding protein with RPS1 domain